MIEQILALLEKVGLREKEAKIYAACLQDKEGLYPHEIVSLTGLNRSTVDVLIDRLMESHHLSRARVGARFKYFAKDPRTLYLEQTQLVDDFKKMLPVLDKLTAGKGDTELRFFEGISGIEEIYKDLNLRMRLGQAEPNELLIISSWQDVMDACPGYMDLVKKRIQLRIPVRIIGPVDANNNAIWFSDPKEYRQVKGFDSTRFPFRIHIDIYGSVVNIVSPVEPIGSFLLVNSTIGASMQSLFNLLWHSTGTLSGH